MATANMGLSLPSVLVTPGPQWASDINAAFTTVDEHDHTSGKGKPIGVAAISVDADLGFNGFSLSSVKSVKLSNQASALADANSVFVAGNELFFKDGSGNPVQLTAAGAVNVGTIGSITGLTSPAAALYNIGTFGFRWFADSATSTLANHEIAAIGFSKGGILGNPAAILSASPSQTFTYNTYLPTAQAIGGGGFVVQRASGQQEYVYPDGSTLIESPAGTLKVGTIGTANLAADSVNSSKISFAVNSQDNQTTTTYPDLTTEQIHISLTGVSIQNGKTYRISLRPTYTGVFSASYGYLFYANNSSANIRYFYYGIKAVRSGGSTRYYNFQVPLVPNAQYIHVPPFTIDEASFVTGTYTFELFLYSQTTSVTATLDDMILVVSSP